MEKVFFEKINGKKVFCLFADTMLKSKSKKLVIMCHGFRGDSPGPARQFVDFQRILVKNGYSVLRFDQPHSGNSEGDYINTSFKEWVETIVYFVDKFIGLGYEVNLLGQSMGASATVASINHKKIKNKVPCILVWVPDPETDFFGDPNKIYEEGGQRYKGSFWQEAKDSNFFECLKSYNGKIHLVYGEVDRYVSRELMDQTIKIVQDKDQGVMILKGQDHSPWEYDSAQDVFKKELEILKK